MRIKLNNEFFKISYNASPSIDGRGPLYFYLTEVNGQSGTARIPSVLCSSRHDVAEKARKAARLIQLIEYAETQAEFSVASHARLKLQKGEF